MRPDFSYFHNVCRIRNRQIENGMPECVKDVLPNFQFYLLEHAQEPATRLRCVKLLFDQFQYMPSTAAAFQAHMKKRIVAGLYE